VEQPVRRSEHGAVHLPAGLPETVVLAPYRSVLHRAGLALQIGLDPDNAVEVSDLSAGMVRLLAELRRVQPTAGLVERAYEWGVQPADATALLAELVAAGAVVDAGQHRRVGKLCAAANVRVHGDGPIAPATVDGLAAAGVGVVYRAGAEASRRWIPDLVVLADGLVPAPEVLAALLDARTPHLAVRVRDGKGLVGPLVLPGRTSCLRCLELHRAARDECWPLLAAQLVDRPGQASAACTAATAAFGVEQAIAAIDAVLGAAGRTPPPAMETIFELDVGRGVLSRRHVPAHPACPCRAAAGG
jgi:bacteriocin biosynthesis cyclodehydratase domain-containing protein